MPDENPTPIKETDSTLLKKRVEARVAMGGNVQKEVPPPIDEKAKTPVTFKESITLTPLKKESTSFSNKEPILTPPAFKIPPKENTDLPKITSEIKKEKTPESISIVPTNHQGAGLPKGEVLSEEIVAKKKRFIIGSILFTLLGGLLIILAVVFFKKEPTVPAQPVPLPIVPDATTVITEGITTEETKQLIRERIDAVSSPTNSLHVIALYKDTENIPLNGVSLFSALGVTLPTPLESGLNDVLFGFTHNETKDAFFVLKIKSGNTFYEAAVRGMQIWEKDITETLGTFISKREVLESGVWSDDTLANIPIRIKKGRGGYHIMYGFFNKETIVIAKTKELFEKVTRRLRTPLPLGGN
jgi:hypothetical protein